MLLSVVSVLVVAQPSSEIPEGLMNNSVFYTFHIKSTDNPITCFKQQHERQRSTPLYTFYYK